MPAVLVTGPTVTQNSPFLPYSSGNNSGDLRFGVFFPINIAQYKNFVYFIMNSTHFAYPRRDGQAELARVAWLNAKTVSKRTVTPLSTNLAQLRVTLLMGPTTLPLS